MAAADVFFHPEAAAEYVEAVAWYASRSEGIASRFEQEVERAVGLIDEAPHRWPPYDGVHRKILLRRFPYLLIYREHDGRWWVVAVAHGHRRPGYWKDRVIEP